MGYALSLIVVDERFANSTDRRGATLIPPTLWEFGVTFAEDVQAVLGITARVVVSAQYNPEDIFLTVNDEDAYLNAAGRVTSEGYRVAVNASGVVVEGASSLGAWWATRTLLQQAALRNGSLPFGVAVDAPGWPTRGMMLDAGRHFYPKDFLLDIDNLWNNPKYTRADFLGLYARFRLWSDDDAVQGLNNFANESYTRAEFDDIQRGCAARGVTVLPEIEAPGHALVITQWKPHLAYGRDMSLLNISHPETIPTMTTVWATFLDWFHCTVVSIGADEYHGPAADYYRFVNAMASFIGTRSGKAVRTWGMYPPRPHASSPPIYQNVSIQHWEFFEDDPYFDYILNNYSVVNSNDDFYVVNKYGGYPNTLDAQQTFAGSPDGGFWRPTVFDQQNATRNPSENNSYVLGAIAALWNDQGPNATVYSEAYYAWRQGLPAVADKQWGGNLTAARFRTVFDRLQSSIPGQNLGRAVPSKGPTIFNYTFRRLSPSPANPVATPVQVLDESPNGYDAATNYVNDTATATIFSGRDSALVLAPSLALFASGNFYSLDTKIPLQDWVDIRLTGKGNQTFAVIAGPGQQRPTTEEFRTRMGNNGDGFHYAEMAIEAPIQRAGGSNCNWTGQIRNLSLTSVAY
ncbi:Glycoside hydrolase, superfamily [Niveomyces insectorum RCEF 264]|uniref:beta-N-acetylhexosaminidase n=1 Tax=Niveomyces insectorum RCEF 264 TaxID=1081102 RepID=A0A162KZD6_9HYPO|nr:Glycoside hydrolase, superfamily [Niveomyces insectorum RCEF 264]